MKLKVTSSLTILILMKICELLNRKKPLFSFEIFPPKGLFNFETINTTIKELVHLNPDFISVTYGAGGSTKGKTLEISSLIKNTYQMDVLAHLTCVSATKSEIADIAKELSDKKIENILALRGDLPTDPNIEFPNPKHYKYATDLIEHLNINYDFCIGGAFYPEGHVESPSLWDDMYYLKKKAKKGAEFLISQLFFDNDRFFQFIHEFQNTGTKIPLIAGIFPITTPKQIWRMAALSGCSIPSRLSKMVARNINNPKKLRQESIQFAIEQIQDLVNRGIDGIHIYTMNKPEVAKAIMTSIEM